MSDDNEPAGSADETGHGMPTDLEAVLDRADAAQATRAGRYDAPPLPPFVVLPVVGLLCGLATVGLVWLSEQGCSTVRGTPNCGALGLPLLVVTVVLAVALGAVAISRLALPQPRLVAFLGVGFMILIVVGLLSGHLFSRSTVVVVPVVTAVTFLVAHLVARWLERADA